MMGLMGFFLAASPCTLFIDIISLCLLIGQNKDACLLAYRIHQLNATWYNR